MEYLVNGLAEAIDREVKRVEIMKSAAENKVDAVCEWFPVPLAINMLISRDGIVTSCAVEGAAS